MRRHTEAVKTQERRDDETVVIFTAMLGLTAVAVVGIVLFGVANALTGPVDGPLDVALRVLLGVLCACLASAPLGYLHRHGRSYGTGRSDSEEQR